MKKTIIIQGSPRRNGNAERACRYINEGIAGQFSVTLLNLYEKHVERCRGCRICMKNKGCAITNDDFASLWSKIIESDVILQAAPVYWYSPPGLMKDFIDRTHAVLPIRDCLAGKTGFIVTVAADAGFEYSERIMASWIEYYGGTVDKKIRLWARESDDLEKLPSNISAMDEMIETLKQVG